MSWTTVTDDPATLPPEDEPVIVEIEDCTQECQEYRYMAGSGFVDYEGMWRTNAFLPVLRSRRWKQRSGLHLRPELKVIRWHRYPNLEEK